MGFQRLARAAMKQAQAEAFQFGRRPADVLARVLPPEIELTMDPATGKTFAFEVEGERCKTRRKRGPRRED